jgi:hypothetical protein
VQEVLSVGNVTQEEKYLGPPTPDGRMGKEKFETIKESERSEKVTRGVNESQSKFLAETWPISKIKPNTPLF